MNATPAVPQTTAVERLIDALTLTVRIVCGVLLMLMVIFTVYTVVMRYVFLDPPFWGDTLSVFCNIWITMLGYSLAVRDREDIALRGIYSKLPRRAGHILDMVWTAMVLAFGLYLIWFGWQAAMDVPGMFWELGGLKKSVPMMIMPVAGGLVALAALALLIEDTLILMGRRPWRELDTVGAEPI